jgi:hypothetical protein
MENSNRNIAGEKTAIILLFSFLILLTSVNPFDKTLSSRFLSLMIIGVAILPYIAWRNDPNREKIIPGVMWYGIFYMITFGIAGFVEHEIKTGALQVYSDTSENIAKMLVVMHLSIVFTVFYSLKSLFKQKVEVKNVDTLTDENNNQFYFIIFLCFIFTVIRVISATAGGLLVGMMSTLSFMYLFYFIFVRNKGDWRLLIIACLGFLVIRGGFQGNIKPFVDLGFLLFFMNLQKNKILILPALFLVLSILIYQPIKSTVRPLMTEIGVDSSESFSMGLEGLQEKNLSLINLVDIASHRIDHNVILSSFVENIDSNDYIKWEAYRNLPYAPIPRFLWPGKPQDFFGNQWGVQEGYLNRNDHLTSLNLPWLSQMYLSYGPIGIIIGSIIVGIILFLLNRFYWTAPNRPWDYAIGLVALLMMFAIDSDFSVTFGVLTKFIMIDLFVRFVRNTIDLRRKSVLNDL